MLLTDARTGAVLDANLTAQHVYGYSQLEFQTKTMPEIRAASSRQLQDAREKAARDPGSPSIMPHRLANGEIRWMEEYTTEFPLGESTGLFSIFVDITERRALETAHLQNEESARLRVEEALRLSEEKFFQAFKINPDSININRFADGEYVDINDGFTAMTGYTREDVLGRSSLPGDLGIWVNREDRERMLTLLQSQGEVIGLEAPFRRKDGTVLIGSLSARILEIKGERCILTITRDLTQRIRQEKALQERERNYREIFNSTSDGLGILDEMGTLIDANEQLCALFGVVRPETINRSLGEFIHGEPPFSLAEAEAYLHLAQTAGPQAFSWKFGDMSGNIGWVEVVL
jgi:PAS domain S-box-containing protein